MSLTYPALLIATIRQPEWLAAGPLAFASWVKLVCRCSEDENGGVLPGADRWTPHVWLTYANVTPEGIDAAVDAGLCTWSGQALVVNGYDHGAQAKVARLRGNGVFGAAGAEFGRLGGRGNKKGGKKTPGSDQNGGGVFTPQPPLEGSKGAGQKENPTSEHPKTPSETPSGGLEKPPLTLPSPSDPFRSQPTLPAPAGAGVAPAGSGWNPGPTKPPPRLWDADYWFKAFGRAWCERKQRVLYGRGGVGDSRARADLGDHLAELPESERLKAQSVADRMFALFLDVEDEKTVDAGHPFSWFVQRFNGLFARAAGGKPGANLRVVRSAIADLPAPVQRPAEGRVPQPETRSAGDEAERAKPGISSSGAS